MWCSLVFWFATVVMQPSSQWFTEQYRTCAMERVETYRQACLASRGKGGLLDALGCYNEALDRVLKEMGALELHSGDPSKLPSAMVGREVPNFTLPPVDGLLDKGAPMPGFAAADLKTGAPTIVNVFASWCVPCHEEHPVLMELATQPGIRLYGINYKDDAASARRFLGRFGNPFARVGADASGRIAIDWGVYGVPETYVIGGDGKIAYRHVGPLTEDVIKEKLLPLLQSPATADK